MTAQQPAPRNIKPLILILLISLAPVVFALLAYYAPALGLRPQGHTNYGALIDPQRPVPSSQALPLVSREGEPFDLASLRGKWILVTADSADCPESCVKKLFTLRNSHASQGKNVDRLARVWFLIDDQADVSPQLLEAYKGTHMLRVDADELLAFLAPAAGPADRDAALKGPMWIIDPLGNLMMAFPPDADPISVRDDITKLLKNSRVG
ncbi:MAG: hypothetical protein WC284_04740 [Candidimonas sp.]